MELHADLCEHWYVLDDYSFYKLKGIPKDYIFVDDSLENEKLILLLFTHD